MVRVGPSVPLRLIDPRACLWQAEAVRLWLNAGLLEDSPSSASISDLACVGLQALVNRHWSGMRWLDMHFRLTSNVLAALEIASDDGRDCGEELEEELESDFGLAPGERHLGVAIWPERSNQDLIDIRPGIEALERTLSGLGAACLRALEDVLPLYDCATFPLLEYAAETCQWRGYQNEKELQEDVISSYGEEDYQFEGVTRAQLDAAMPPKPLRQRVDLAEIERAAAGQKGKAGVVGEALVELRATGPMQPMFRGVQTLASADIHTSSMFPVCLVWGDESTTTRVLDDYLQMLCESGEGVKGVSGAHALSLESPSAIMDLEHSWSIASRQWRCIDRILTVLDELQQ